MAKTPTRLIPLRDLPSKGITWHVNTVRKKVKAGEFPAPIYISERRPCWIESVLDAWIAQREREAAANS